MPIEGFFYLQCWWWLILQHANSLVAQIRSAKCPSAPDVSFLLLAADLASGKVTNALTQQFPSVWNPKVMPELPQPWCKALKAAVPYSKQDLFQPPETQQWLGGTTVFPTKKEKKETSEHVAFRGMLLQWRMAAWLLSAAPGPVSETPLCPQRAHPHGDDFSLPPATRHHWAGFCRQGLHDRQGSFLLPSLAGCWTREN